MSALRISLWVGLLIAELALIGSLHWLGWFGTGSALVWIGALVVTILPLALAGALAIRGRGQFSLRALLAFVALIAVFLGVSGTPLVDFHSQRRVSSRLKAAGAHLRVNSPMDDYYSQLGFDPRAHATHQKHEIPTWLRPLAGSAAAIPAERSIRGVLLYSDEQIEILCEQPERFESLEGIVVGPRVTPDGLRELVGTFNRFPHATEFQTYGVLPDGLIESLPSATSLFLHARIGTPLPAEVLDEAGSLPDLEVLMVFGYQLQDSDAAKIGQCKSLRHLILQNTGISAAGTDAIAEALPNCVVHRE